ncbi:MAG: DUF4276 family protein [Acidobacteriota bacterium]
MIVEGQTEQAVCNQLIYPHLLKFGFDLSARLIGKRGGTKSFSVLVDDVKRSLQSNAGCYVTTLFDYYALTSTWPDVRAIKQRQGSGIYPAVLAGTIEQSIASHIIGTISADILWPGHFIPYIQLHELEALLFSGPKEMAVTFGDLSFEARFQAILTSCGSCEEINDSPATAPSKRIESIYPGYKKGKSDRAHAPIILQNIGLDRIRAACPRFDAWLKILEALSPLPQACTTSV